MGWSPGVGCTLAAVVSEQHVEQALEAASEQERVEALMMEFATEQTPAVQYFYTDGFSLLTEAEREYLQYLGLVVYTAAKRTYGQMPELAAEDLERWDELAWTWMQDSVGKPWAQRLDIFFSEIDEEELLAFAEDALHAPDDKDDNHESDGEESDEQLLFDSSPSRELAFVGLAVLIGALHEASAEQIAKR